MNALNELNDKYFAFVPPFGSVLGVAFDRKASAEERIYRGLIQKNTNYAAKDPEYYYLEENYTLPYEELIGYLGTLISTDIEFLPAYAPDDGEVKLRIEFLKKCYKQLTLQDTSSVYDIITFLSRDFRENREKLYGVSAIKFYELWVQKDSVDSIKLHSAMEELRICQLKKEISDTLADNLINFFNLFLNNRPIPEDIAARLRIENPRH